MEDAIGKRMAKDRGDIREDVRGRLQRLDLCQGPSEGRPHEGRQVRRHAARRRLIVRLFFVQALRDHHGCESCRLRLLLLGPGL